MKITDLAIDSKKTVGSRLLLTDVSPYYEYVDGQKTQNVKGQKWVVVMQERGFEKLAVKVEGQCKDNIVVGEECVEVEFENLELFVYWMNGTFNVGARATGIHLVKK